MAVAASGSGVHSARGRRRRLPGNPVSALEGRASELPQRPVAVRGGHSEEANKTLSKTFSSSLCNDW